jgi:predicted nuclease of predicted toxin-antitoxin system
MKFLVDAHLPYRIALFLRSSGYDAIHTQDLPLKNKISDSAINELSMREERIVMTKDSDFVESFLLLHKPYKLLLISTGNISNNDLESLLSQHIQHLAESFENHDFIEINQNDIIFHC